MGLNFAAFIGNVNVSILGGNNYMGRNAVNKSTKEHTYK
jgi:hypothetical protein